MAAAAAVADAHIFFFFSRSYTLSRNILDFVCVCVVCQDSSLFFFFFKKKLDKLVIFCLFVCLCVNVPGSLIKEQRNNQFALYKDHRFNKR